MNTRHPALRSTLIFSLSGLILVAAVLLGSRPAKVRLEADVLTATPTMQWYRGNIHTHSLWSDGDDYPEMIARWYQQHDYQFLAFTDHNVLHNSERWTDVDGNKGKRVAYDKLKEAFGEDWVEERTTDAGRTEVRLKKFGELARRFNDPGKFLLIQGEEITDRFKNLPVHMNATNVQSLIPPLHGESVYETMQNNVNAVWSQRERTGEPVLIHLNHPNFGYGVTAEDLMRVRGENFFEVYNGHPGVRNSGDEQHASTERIWDIILTKRLAELELPPMYGLATDDGHSYHRIPSRASEPGRGWVMVLTDTLSPESLITAMERGRFYASSGVTLRSVSQHLDALEVEVDPESGVEYTIDFIGTRRGYDPLGKPVLGKDGKEIRATLRYSEQIGATLATVNGPKARYVLTGDEIYVRARVTSNRLHPNPSETGEFERAWTQPLVPGLKP